MARRRSEATVILNFFRDTTLETAQFTFDLVKDVMRERMPKKKKPAVAAADAKKKSAPSAAASVVGEGKTA
jgi:hypothetical protein